MGEPIGLSPEQLRVLERLKEVPGIGAFYLAGGTAIAVHLRHRRSLDLDLFSVNRDVDLQEITEAAASVLPELRVLSQTDAALRAVVGQVVLDMVRYRYPPLASPAPGPIDFPIAGLEDLAAMKLAAIAQRGLRRDFWDLHAICTSGLSLLSATDAYVRRFGKGQADLYHVLRSLTYFDDAERETAWPGGLGEEHWGVIKAFFLVEAPEVLTALARRSGTD